MFLWVVSPTRWSSSLTLQLSLLCWRQCYISCWWQSNMSYSLYYVCDYSICPVIRTTLVIKQHVITSIPCLWLLFMSCHLCYVGNNATCHAVYAMSVTVLFVILSIICQWQRYGLCHLCYVSFYNPWCNLHIMSVTMSVTIIHVWYFSDYTTFHVFHFISVTIQQPMMSMLVWWLFYILCQWLFNICHQCYIWDYVRAYSTCRVVSAISVSMLSFIICRWQCLL